MSQWRPRPLKSILETLDANQMNGCCLREENLFTAEHVPGHRVVRQCRVCKARHIRVRAETIPLFSVGTGIGTTMRRSTGARRIRMHASGGGLAGI